VGTDGLLRSGRLEQIDLKDYLFTRCGKAAGPTHHGEELPDLLRCLVIIGTRDDIYFIVHRNLLGVFLSRGDSHRLFTLLPLIPIAAVPVVQLSALNRPLPIGVIAMENRLLNFPALWCHNDL
jgi:hypothetical protein